MRETLVSMILESGLSVKKVSQILGMKYSTAKHIFHFYKTTGETWSIPLKKLKVVYTPSSNVAAQPYELS